MGRKTWVGTLVLTLVGVCVGAHMACAAEMVFRVERVTGDLWAKGWIETATGFKFPDGTTMTTAALGNGNGWSLTGNSGTNPDTHFLGTTDDVAFEIRTNNKRVFRIGTPFGHGFSFGHDANAKYYGSFVFADESGWGDFNSVTHNEFAIRAAGGLRLHAPYETYPYLNAVQFRLEYPHGHWTWSANTDGHMSCPWEDPIAGEHRLTLETRHAPWTTSVPVLSFVHRGDPVIDDFRWTEVYFEGWVEAWAFYTSSDRSIKANFAGVDTVQLLDALAGMPVTTWNLQAQSEEVRHIGPVAQDFNASFGYLFGEVERELHINTMDAVGVSLAASQGLYTLVQQQAGEITQLTAENAQQTGQIAQQAEEIEDLRARLEALEKLVQGSE